jgi:DNA-binding MarR family transcriptional regulator
MQTSVSPIAEPVPAPETVEDAVMSLMMTLGRRVRHKQPGDVVDFSAFPILKVLSHQGPMRLSALAQSLGLDASTVSRQARQLEDRGLLERTGDPDDGRASRVAVSELGQACLTTAFAARRQLIAHALEDMSAADQDTLRDLLHVLVVNLANQETKA